MTSEIEVPMQFLQRQAVFAATEVLTLNMSEGESALFG